MPNLNEIQVLLVTANLAPCPIAGVAVWRVSTASSRTTTRYPGRHITIAATMFPYVAMVTKYRRPKIDT